MPLTEQQKKRLEELRAKRSATIENVPNEYSVSNEDLIGQLSKLGGLPQQNYEHFRPADKKGIKDNIYKQTVYNELQNRGLDPNTIKFGLVLNRKLNAPRYGRMIGATAASIGAGLATGGLDPTDLFTMPTVYAAVAAGGGGIAGEAIQTGIEEKRLIGKREALKAFSIEAGTELGGRAFVSAGKLLFSPLVKKTIPEAADLIEDYARVGGIFSPTELDNRYALSMAESASRGQFGGKILWDRFEQKEASAAKAFADNIIDSIVEQTARQSPTDIGQEFAESISRPSGRIMKIFDDLVDPLYQQVDEMSKTAITTTKGLKQFASEQLERDAALKGLFLSPSGRTKLTKVIELPDTIQFSQMRQLRSTFLADVRQMARDADKNEGIIKKISQLADEAIRDESKYSFLSPEAANLLKNTNALYREGSKALETTFSDKLLKRFIKNPTNVVAEIFPKKNPIAIRSIRNALTKPIAGQESPEGKLLWNKLRQAWLADAVEKTFTKEGTIKSGALETIMKNMGDEAVGEIFPEPAQRASVERLKTLFKVISKRPPTGFSLYVRGAQTGGAYMIYRGGQQGDYIQVAAGGVLVFGPYAFAKLAMNPEGLKLLTSGIKMRSGSTALMPTAIRTVNLLRQIDKQEKAREKDVERLKKLKEKYGFGKKDFNR